MNQKLKNNLISAFAAAAIASGGFLAKEHFESSDKKEEFVLQLYKKLYDDGASKIKQVNKAYSDLFSLYSRSYALTSYELSKNQIEFENSLENYSEYIDELKRYGTTNQVEVAKKYQDWLLSIYAELNLQFDLSKQIENRARQLLLVKNIKSEEFKFIDNALDSDIKRLINNENRIYYAIGENKKPVLDTIEQYINYQFRESINIPPTNDMISSINSAASLIEKSNKFDFKDKKYPFMFAEGRAFEAPELEFGGDTSFYKQKDDILAHNTKLKFIATVIQNDKQLQSELKQRGTKQSKKTS